MPAVTYNDQQFEAEEVLTAVPQRNNLRFSRTSWLCLIAVLAISAAYAGFYLKRGWIPHDDGAFALSAERVMRGELPHRDFQEIYTGGLAFMHAAVMQALGDRLVVMRFPLFGFFLLWTISLFAIARRFASDSVAAVATLLAVAMSIPNYSAAVPSWYNLFFATYAILFVLRAEETKNRKWLFLAGVCAGLSCLVKIAGLYLVAAVLLFLVFRIQESHRRNLKPSGVRLFRFFVVAGCLLFVGALLRMLGPKLDATHLFHFVLPSACICGMLIWRELSGKFEPDASRWKHLARSSGIFLTGAIIPIAMFLVPYVRSGSVSSLVEGIFILPFRRLVFAARPPASLKYLAGGIFLCCLLVAGIYFSKHLHRYSKILMALMFAAGLYMSWADDGIYRLVWNSLALMVPLTILFAVLDITRSRESSRQHGPAFLLLSVLAVCSLVQFPFGHPIYFLYIAPLLPLAWIATASMHPNWSRFTFGITAISYTAFLVALVTPGYIINMGIAALPEAQQTPMTVSKARGLRVFEPQAPMYQDVVNLVEQRAGGDYIYCAPDCPEVYVLSSKRSPVRSDFDFLDNSTARVPRILSNLDEHHVKMVVIRSIPEFSPMSPDLLRELRSRYPQVRRTGTFEIRWQE